jgi:AcrR family transcriptional regulator
MPTVPVRRRLPPAERREEILVTATELIAASGYQGLSLEAFADACGMTKAGLLHHFSSKEDLLIAVLQRRDILDEATVDRDALHAPDAATARAMTLEILERNFGQPRFLQLYTRLSAEALDPANPAHEYFQLRLERARGILTDSLLLWHPNPAAAAVELLAFLDGLQLNWLRDRTIDVPTQWNLFADRFFRV